MQQRLDNKKKRPDYAANILDEFNCLNLMHFWERATKEKDDFRDLFNLESTETVRGISIPVDEE